MLKKPAEKPRSKRKTASDKTVARKKAPTKIAVAEVVDKTLLSEGGPPSSLELSREVSGLESGDLEGLSNVESADSESVDELLEEGNAFEAGGVWGVEYSREREGKEVRTREVPEDDVPGEYLDEQ
ncbi:MAG: hypothetical protein ABR956_12515 [Terracidiphilus sp.]|jgi:hypothetical protein